ncbi:hypothetical protein BT96DRAFT_1021031 [Gymnopus androsaceus JB14]|uniref:Uncharacterized protein n=1 Tax=Gymnopus androsaceus JB14 TaxID=1447944 RepID=A0A6A4HIS8_9AGAR|nr:hypothetical protein BT96DRAFT_1021031 [Gymnopus androsaceus JB14]
MSFSTSYSLTSNSRRGFTKNVAIWALFVGVVVTVMMTTAYSALYFQIFFEFLRVGLVENTSQPLEVRFELAQESIANASSALQWLGGAGGGFIYLIGDAVSVWRVWAICSSSHRKLVFLPIILFLGGLGTSIGFNVLNTPPPPFLFTGSAIWDLQLLGLILPLTTNVVATALIAYQTYSYRGFMKANFSLGHSKTGSILSLLTESGVVYCVIQAIDVTLILTDDAPLSSPQDQATRLFDQFTLFVSPMIPLFVILIVYSQRSITEAMHGSTSGGTTPSVFDAGTHISFANRERFGGSSAHYSADLQQSNTIRMTQGEGPSVEKIHPWMYNYAGDPSIYALAMLPSGTWRRYYIARVPNHMQNQSPSALAMLPSM